MSHFSGYKTKIARSIAIGAMGLGALFMTACGSSPSAIVSSPGVGDASAVSTPTAIPGLASHDMGGYYTLNLNGIDDYKYYLHYLVNHAGSDPESIISAYVHGRCDYSVAISKLSDADQIAFGDAVTDVFDSKASDAIGASGNENIVSDHIAYAENPGGLTLICVAKEK
ncbi:hypothetical protein [[Mycobacterium] vasticus]|uniref:Lipoprotein n=1 Tax=[Mycobacterium] vasticus TaxID=2875777 RepID=A0ABU5YVF7_9MYCO|nr:hypothetical protein [Mycolicibacter sp. MYC017]MEB3069107.1 hypothetical protein [Mycolicibacter sp. MYC017]